MKVGESIRTRFRRAELLRNKIIPKAGSRNGPFTSQGNFVELKARATEASCLRIQNGTPEVVDASEVLLVGAALDSSRLLSPICALIPDHRSLPLLVIIWLGGWKPSCMLRLRFLN